jgi:hypothetical protein
MSTGVIHAGFFPNQIMGSTRLREDMFEAARQYAKDLGGRVIGECVIDATLAGLVVTDDAAAINERKLTVAGALAALAESGDMFNDMGDTSTLLQQVEGSRTITLHDPDWFVDIPYENANGSSYSVYLHLTEYPIDVGVGKPGGRGYSRWVEVPGITINPDSVSDASDHLELVVLTGLTVLGVQPWLTSNEEDADWSMDCVVYLDTDVTGVEIAIDDPDVAIAFTAKLTKRVGNPDWIVDLTGIGDGYLGQETPSTTAAEYKIVVLGPVVTTTDFDSDPDYVHIAQVDSATGSETISHSGQVIVDSLASGIISMPDGLLDGGCLTVPGVTNGTTTADIDGTGVIHTRGQLWQPGAESVGGIPTSDEFFVSFDPDTMSYDLYTTMADALLDDRVPVAYGITDGTPNITFLIGIGKSVRHVSRVVELTLSSDAEARTAFTNLKEALGYCAALSNLADVRGFRINVQGTVNVGTDVVNETELLSVPGVHFVGARMLNSSAAAGVSSGFEWTGVSNSLFSIPSGTTLESWTFENIRFSYVTTVATDMTVAAFSNAHITSNLTFIGCLFDAPSTQIFTAYYSTGNSVNLKFVDCINANNGVWIYNTGSNSLGPLTMRNCRQDGSASASVGPAYGVVWDASTSPGASWRIQDCDFTNLDGPALYSASGLVNGWIKDNRIHFQSGAQSGAGIDLGNGTATADCENLFIHDNHVDLTAYSSATDGIRVYSDRGVPPNMCGIFIHDNYVEMASYPSGSVGIEVGGNANDGVIVHSNVVGGSEFGIFMTGTGTQNVVSSNCVFSEQQALNIGADQYALVASSNSLLIGTGSVPCVLWSGDHGVLTGNYVDGSGGAGAIGLITGSSATNLVVTGNFIEGLDYSIDIDASTVVVSGNRLSGDLRSQDNTHLIIGNVMTGDLDNVTSTQVTVIGNHWTGNMDLNSGTGCIVGANRVTGYVNEIGNGSMLVCNRVDGATGTATSVGMVVTGNLFEDTTAPTTTFDEIGDLVITGNIFRHDPNIDTNTNNDIVMTGNAFLDSSAWTIEAVDGAVTGNYVEGALTLGAGSANLAVVGNRFNAGAPTDSGSGNAVASNT